MSKYSKGYDFLKNSSIVTITLITLGLDIYIIISVIFFSHENPSVVRILILVIPPLFMGIVVGINSAKKRSEDRLQRIIDAMEEVSQGNYGYKINLRNSREYTQLFKDFNSMTDELAKTRAELENFANTFAHEMNTPISSIQGFASLLYETGNLSETPERLRYLKIIADESSRLARLSKNALILSKLKAMQITPRKNKYNLGEQIRKCVILLDREIQEKNIDIIIPENFDFLFFGNEELMQHVWINLLTNAVKYSPQNGKITISHTSSNGKNYVSISDEGPGISDDDATYIFERNFQINADIDTNKGNGLGLAIAKRAAQLNNAEIQLEKNKKDEDSGNTDTSKGCCFTLIFS